ncbi:sigma-70 family RNA polymerase sigma factor [Nocardioides sp. B-3]|nr:sigma-70 family RNA polymerase sigma factor [Nocardioides sp. B-3]UUZ61412.1 sigma-70 family RNA polymerase sigma factor [Nocardioides sp. B-3]
MSTRPSGCGWSSTWTGSTNRGRCPGGWPRSPCNESLRYLQKRNRTVPADPRESPVFERDDESPDLIEELMATERHSALVDALLELPDDRRALLLLLTEDPAPSYAEISRRTGIPVGSIGPTRARAIDQLRKSRALRHLTPPAPDGRTP